MHVLVLTNEYEPYVIGGLGVVATKLSQNMSKHGIKVTVITKSPSRRITKKTVKGVDVIRFPSRSKYHSQKQGLFNFHSTFQWLQKNKIAAPDIIHIHSIHFVEWVKSYIKYYSVPTFYTCHSLILHEKSSKVSTLRRQQVLFRLANIIIAPSIWEAKEINKFYPSVSSKIHVIENGVDFHKTISPLSGSSKFIRISYVGRIVSSKGIRELIHSLPIVKKQFPNVRLDIIGKGSSSFVKQLKNEATKLALSPSIRYIGFLPHYKVTKLYPYYHATVVPSRSESFGLVALEALANGVPLVSTRAGGLNQFVSARVAEIIPRVNKNDIARAITNMLKHRSLTKDRVLRGRKLAQAYSWNGIADRYIKHFRYLQEGGR
jgi:glycosyltransferase involved in cell wall biosynthesis